MILADDILEIKKIMYTVFKYKPRVKFEEMNTQIKNWCLIKYKPYTIKHSLMLEWYEEVKKEFKNRLVYK